MFGQYAFRIHAGDFGKGEGTYSSLTDTFTLPVKDKVFGSKRIPASDLSSLEIATEENVKKIGGTIGWGLAGGAILGPLGLLVGLIAGGRKKEIVFVAKFSDGTKLLASCDGNAFTAIKCVRF